MSENDVNLMLFKTNIMPWQFFFNLEEESLYFSSSVNCYRSLYRSDRISAGGSFLCGGHYKA